jgi:hypothetical protein
MKKIDPIEEGMYAIETLTNDTFVKLSKKASKVWRLVGWDRVERAYEIVDEDDFCNTKYLKKGKKVFAGFIY